MTIIGPDTIADSLEKAVSPQVDEFILAYHAANRENPAPEKTPAAADTEKRISRRAQRSQQVSYKFVASKNSKVFHKPDCPFAKRIKPENLVTFKSRSEAVQAGKRPCKRCNP